MFGAPPSVPRLTALVVIALAGVSGASPAGAAPRTHGTSELVSQFTTRYPCCQPRVKNIRRAAALLDGREIAAGATFSLNAALGKRTRSRGFVAAPMISDGRLVDSVGGGISQLATTLYNGAFFAGVELIAHTPHSLYIPRYPKGREATISWGGPELLFRNDWPAPIQIRIRAAGQAVTVRLYSTRAGRRVTTHTDRPYAYVPPRTVTIVNHALAPGARRLTEPAGGPGFTVAYTRRVYRYRALRRDERFRVRYEPHNAIVEIGPTRSGR